MPAGSETKRFGGWWGSKSKLERTLIVAAAVTTLSVIVLLILVASKSSELPTNICNSPTCINDASKVAEHLDSEVNPCEDFHRFACGNFLKNAHGDEKLGLQYQLQEREKRELLEIYMEPVSNHEHRVVTIAKKLFQSCLNTLEAEKTNLDTLKEAIRAAGGWPVLEGAKWNETNFDWLRATYKFRELGFPFNIFLDVSAVLDPENSTRYILQLAMPHMWNYATSESDPLRSMIDVAMLFGAQDEEYASAELTDTQHFLGRLQLEVHSVHPLGSPSKFVVGKYQQKYGKTDWLRFINRIVGPAARIFKNDTVIFPPPAALKRWMDLISRTPRRIQANYMMLKMVEGMLGFLKDNLQSKDTPQEALVRREDFCFTEIQKRFPLSPIEIMRSRKYLPGEKKKAVEELTLTIKQEFITMLGNYDWNERENKYKAVEYAKATRLVLGQPGNYLEDDVLNDMAVDMVELEKDTFLNRIAQVSRNHQTALYTQIKKSAPDNVLKQWCSKKAGGLPVYNVGTNVLLIPTVSTEEPLFNMERPQYLNYGALGVQLARQFSDLLITHLTQDEIIKKNANCLIKLQEGAPMTFKEIIQIIEQTAGEQIAYAAYEKWVKEHGEEVQLVATDYIPNQLFWILAASVLCQPSSTYNNSDHTYELFSLMVSGSVSSNPKFAKDFNCPEGSKMNPPEKCQML